MSLCLNNPTVEEGNLVCPAVFVRRDGFGTPLRGGLAGFARPGWGLLATHGLFEPRAFVSCLCFA